MSTIGNFKDLVVSSSFHTSGCDTSSFVYQTEKLTIIGRIEHFVRQSKRNMNILKFRVILVNDWLKSEVTKSHN